MPAAWKDEEVSAPKADDFRNLVVKRRDACVKYVEGEPARDRQRALRFYRGENLDEYGDSGDGLSTVVSRDSMEVIESLMPSLIRPFAAGEEVVAYDPMGPEDEEGAKQAADYDNFVFKTHNRGFFVLYDGLKDGLLYRMGVAKTVVEEVEKGPPERYEGLDENQLAAIRAMGREIVGDIAQDPESLLYSVTLAAEKVKRYRVHIIAPDEFLYEEALADVDCATMLGHRKQMTIASLIELGVSREAALSLSSGRPNSEERDNRLDDEDEPEFDRNDMARPVWVDECYIKCDYENAGVLTWRKVLLGGSESKILTNEEADGHPYSVWSPIRIPHKLVGMSANDMAEDIQKNKTAVQREMNNAMYLANRPQREVLDGQVNMEDLLKPTVDGVVRVKQMGAINNLPSGGERVLGSSLQMIEYQDSVREARTGVTRYNQGMDSNSLNKTATGMNIISSASQARQELIARLFGEFLIDIFGNIRKLVSQHASKSEYMRLRGKWVQVDPTDWKTDYDMTASVGLGSNNKDQQVGQLQGLLTVQKEIASLPPESPFAGLVTPQNIFETLKQLQAAMGLKGDKYFTDPEEAQQQAPQQPEEPPVDPLAEPKIKAEAEIQKARINQETEIAKEEMRQQPQVIPFPVDPNMGAM